MQRRAPPLLPPREEHLVHHGRAGTRQTNDNYRPHNVLLMQRPLSVWRFEEVKQRQARLCATGVRMETRSRARAREHAQQHTHTHTHRHTRTHPHPPPHTQTDAQLMSIGHTICNDVTRVGCTRMPYVRAAISRSDSAQRSDPSWTNLNPRSKTSPWHQAQRKSWSCFQSPTDHRLQS